MQRTAETRAWKIPGFLILLFHVLLVGLFLWGINQVQDRASEFLGAGVMACAVLLFVATVSGYVVVQPNEAKAVVFFGRYIGTIRDQGFWWTVPFTTKKKLSLRVRNFNSERLKVNDARGNPIEIAAVVVWRVTQTARALFDVDNVQEFVSIQSETALRTLASKFPYDAHDGDTHSLRGDPQLVADTLKREVEARLEVAGVDVIEARLQHLAYAQEIAQAMLRRQQAEAIIAARQKIVEGAVGMVQMALEQLSEQNIVELDEERKATMVNNLLVVLTSEQESQPVLNAGSLY